MDYDSIDEIPCAEETINAELAMRGIMPGYGDLVAMDVGAFLNYQFPIRDMLLAPFLPQAGLAMLYAARGVGKTYTALGIAHAVARGGEFLRWRAKTPHKVVYVDGEMPGLLIQKRLAAMMPHSPPPLGNFNLITPDTQTSNMCDISTREGQDRLEPYIEHADLIVADNISTLCRSVKENEADSWGPVQEWALRLRQRGKSLLLVHHAGRNGNARGTSRREDILDSIIALKRPDDYKASDGARFEIHYEKARGFYGDDAAPFEAMMEERNGLLHWTMRDVGDESPKDAARRLVRAGATHNDIAKRFGVERSTVSKWIGGEK